MLEEGAQDAWSSAPSPRTRTSSRAPPVHAHADAFLGSLAAARARPMEWVLAEALLAQSPDPRVLLGTLCGGEASAERVETLRFLLQRLEDQGAGAGALPEAAREVAVEYLVPLLRGLRERPGGSDAGPPCQRQRVLRAAGAALRSCARLAGPMPLAAALAEDALRELQAARAPGALAALEVLAAVGPCLRPREDGLLLERVARAAVALALAGDGCSEDAAALVAVRLLPALGQCGGAALRAVWDALAAPDAPSGPGRIGPELLVLSALAEKLLPEPGARDPGPDARHCARFWRTVQAGLGRADDALTRKRARYLLQRAVEVSAELGDDCTCGPQDATGTYSTLPAFPGAELPASGNQLPGSPPLSLQFGYSDGTPKA